MNYFLLIGQLSLNISFVLYLLLYLPQVLHNRKVKNIAELSQLMHYLLFITYFFDLFYGFLSNFQWQYKTVSVVGLLLIGVQHLQITRFLFKQGSYNFVLLNTLVGGLSLVILSYFFIMPVHASAPMIVLFGSMARLASFSYCLPQIFRNYHLKSANAINPKFIYLNTTLACLDTISAWSLNWGWPNKLASPATILIMMVLLFQNHQYKKINGVRLD